jgi:hypothetical protein
LDDGVDVNWKDEEGFTALIWACVYGHVEVVKLLLDRGALIDLLPNGGGTALMNASYDGKIECVRLLLERGADMSLKDNTGKTAKDDAVKQGYDDIVQLLNEVCMLQIQDNLISFILPSFRSLSMSSCNLQSTKPRRNATSLISTWYKQLLVILIRLWNLIETSRRRRRVRR